MRRRILDKIASLKKSEFVKNSAILASGTGLAQLVPVLISPILTRLYSPEDYGILGVFNSIVSVFAVMAAWGYHLGIMLPIKQKAGANMLAISIGSALLTSLFLLLVFSVFNAQTATLVGNQQIAVWLYFVPLVVFFRSAYESLSVWLNRNKEFKSIASTKVLTRLVSSSGQIGGGLAQLGPIGLIGSVILGAFTGTAFLLRQSLLKMKEVSRQFSVTKIRYLLRRYKKFPTFSMPSSLLNSFSLQVPVFILSAFFAESVVGFYALAHRIISMPLHVVGQAISNVFYQQASAIRNDTEKLNRLTYRTFKNLLLIGILPLGIVTVFGDYLFSFVFGEQWLEAGRFAMLLAPWMLLNFVSSPISRLLTILEKQEKSLIVNIVLLGIRIIPLLLGSILLFTNSSYNTILFYSVFNMIFWIVFIFYLVMQVKIRMFLIFKTVLLYYFIPLGFLFIIRFIFL